MTSRSVPEVAEGQSDVFTRAQAYAEGWNARQVRRRIEAGRWRVVAGAALCAEEVRIGPWQLARAALLTWPGAVVSHQVAGQLHGLPVQCGDHGSAIVAPARKVKAPGWASAGEDRLHLLLRGARIEGWRANVAIHVNGRFVAVVDLLFVGARVIVEFDGYSTHSGREAFQSDRSQQNRLITAGYVVLRFTWDDVVRRPDYVLETIRRALRGPA